MSDKQVKDLMLALSEYATVGEDATLKEALNALSKAQLGLHQDRHYHRAVLVLNRAGRVVGKLSHWAILRALQPRTLRNADVASMARAGLPEAFLETLKQNMAGAAGNLEQLCHHAASVRACDAMVPVLESIDEQASMTQAVQEMVAKHCQSMLVTRSGKVIGILRMSDVFQEVADRIRSAACTDPGPD